MSNRRGFSKNKKGLDTRVVTAERLFAPEQNLVLETIRVDFVDANEIQIGALRLQNETVTSNSGRVIIEALGAINLKSKKITLNSTDFEVTGTLALTGDISITGNASVGGDLSVTGNATVGADLSVTGDINVTGLVDGRDIATDGTAQDNHIADATIHFTEASIDHGNITGLGDDDHTQYTLLAGRVGGQTIIGGTAASESLTLSSTSNASKGTIIVSDQLDLSDNLVGTGTSEIRESIPASVDSRTFHGLLRVTYDFTVDGGAVGTINLAKSLPDKAIVTRGYYETVTGFTGNAGATFQLGVATDGVAELKAATLVTDGTLAVTGLYDLIPDGTVTNATTKTTAERTIDVIIGTDIITAGKLVAFLEYIISD